MKLNNEEEQLLKQLCSEYSLTEALIFQLVEKAFEIRYKNKHGIKDDLKSIIIDHLKNGKNDSQ